MSLHGSLDTFPLTDVLGLLATTKKSGELRVVGARAEGRLWVEDGCLVAAEAGRSHEPINALFELMRLPEGTFSFDADRRAPRPNAPVVVDAVIAEASARLVEWRSIEAVVPSLAHAVAMAAELAGPEVRIRAEQWRVLVAIGSGGSVQDVLDGLGLAEFDGCRALRDLVDAGLVAVGEPVAPTVLSMLPVPGDASSGAGIGGDADGPARDVDGPDARGRSTRSWRETSLADDADDDGDDIDDDGSGDIDDDAVDDPAWARPAMAGIGSASDSRTRPPGSANDAPVRSARMVKARTRQGATATATPATSTAGARAGGATATMVKAGSDGEDLGPSVFDGERFEGERFGAERFGAERFEGARFEGEQLDGEVGDATDDAEAVEGDEPINRGLLLKFLSSVKS